MYFIQYINFIHCYLYFIATTVILNLMTFAQGQQQDAGITQDSF